MSRVSDVVSVGQQISLMCIGQDVRGNIKLSRKATLPWPGSETKSVVEGSAPVAKEAPNIWASLENVSNGKQQKSTLEELPLSQNENTASNPSASSPPAVVIRSATECDEEEKSAGLSKTSKSAPKQKGTLKRENKLKTVQSSGNKPDSTLSNLLPESFIRSASEKEKSAGLSKTSKSATKRKGTLKSGNKLKELVSEDKDEGETDQNNQNNKETDVKSPMTPQKLKLGTKITAKIYQIRARGLVLDLGGGIRGMYRFEVCIFLSDTAIAFLLKGLVTFHATTLCPNMTFYYYFLTGYNLFLSSVFPCQCFKSLPFSR